MALEQLLSNQFERMLSGEKTNAVTKDWAVSNCNDSAMAVLYYKENAACYTFQIMQNKQGILFYNNHREASVLGAGTAFLKQLETAFQELATRRKCVVKIIFDPFDQKDTEHWLKKNNYAQENGIYSKIYFPEHVKKLGRMKY